MGVSFSADDMLAIAETIERNGVKFYRAAADKAECEGCTKFLQDLAEWEVTHEQTFAGMRADLTAKERQPTAFDPNDEAVLYLQALADKSVFDVDEDPLAALGEQPTMAGILAAAIGKEKDSIAFYVGMKEVVPEALGTDKVEKIIKEEMSHVTTLTKKLSEVKQ